MSHMGYVKTSLAFCFTRAILHYKVQKNYLFAQENQQQNVKNLKIKRSSIFVSLSINKKVIHIKKIR